jgi:hypothetical protein
MILMVGLRFVFGVLFIRFIILVGMFSLFILVSGFLVNVKWRRSDEYENCTITTYFAVNVLDTFVGGCGGRGATFLMMFCRCWYLFI